MALDGRPYAQPVAAQAARRKRLSIGGGPGRPPPIGAAGSGIPGSQLVGGGHDAGGVTQFVQAVRLLLPLARADEAVAEMPVFTATP